MSRVGRGDHGLERRRRLTTSCAKGAAPNGRHPVPNTQDPTPNTQTLNPKLPYPTPIASNDSRMIFNPS